MIHLHKSILILIFFTLFVSLVYSDDTTYGNHYTQYNSTADIFISRDNGFCNKTNCWTPAEFLNNTVGGFGDITSVNTFDIFLSGGCTEGDCNLTANMSAFNDTMDARDNDTIRTNGTGISLVGNIFSIVLSYFQGLFLGIDDQRYNETDSINSINNLSNESIIGLTQDNINPVNFSVDYSQYTNTSNLQSLNETEQVNALVLDNQTLHSQVDSGENVSMQEVYDNHSNSGYLTSYTETDPKWQANYSGYNKPSWDESF